MQKRYFSRLATPREVAAEIGLRARRLRLQKNLRQADLAKRARVSIATIGRFEATGEASFAAVLRIATALGVDQALLNVFLPPPRSIDELGERGGRIRRRALRGGAPADHLSAEVNE
ncbi:MAG: helix-turn-helix transcriptional regulator [Candidatus Eremiobacteraeota bacterium]|nr:helix-turn-helix transcriptional regulator [Candidatus Eremiobacteraeota bacterium]